MAQLAREVDKWAGPFCQGDPAEWRAVRGCCGARNLLCTSCREVYEHHRSIGATFTCALCQNQHSGYAYFEAL